MYSCSALKIHAIQNRASYGLAGWGDGFSDEIGDGLDHFWAHVFVVNAVERAQHVVGFALARRAGDDLDEGIELADAKVAVIEQVAQRLLRYCFLDAWHA